MQAVMKVARQRLSVLELAQKLGNVSDICGTYTSLSEFTALTGKVAGNSYAGRCWMYVLRSNERG